MIATLTALTAASIAAAYQAAAVMPAEMIVGGGGARNPVLMTLLRQFLPHVAVKTHEDIGMDSDNKEALVFAVLAYESWFQRVGVLPSLTGAQHATILGNITPGANYRALLQETFSDLGRR
jgi:anhydro-N-acetylmuramic acid kinase